MENQNLPVVPDNNNQAPDPVPTAIPAANTAPVETAVPTANPMPVPAAGQTPVPAPLPHKSDTLKWVLVGVGGLLFIGLLTFFLAGGGLFKGELVLEEEDMSGHKFCVGGIPVVGLNEGSNYNLTIKDGSNCNPVQIAVNDEDLAKIYYNKILTATVNPANSMAYTFTGENNLEANSDIPPVVSWDFGESDANGPVTQPFVAKAAITHTFTTPGEHTIKIHGVMTLADNSTITLEAKKNITVTAPAAPAAPADVNQIPDNAVVFKFSCNDTGTPLETSCSPGAYVADKSIKLYNPMWNFGDNSPDSEGGKSADGLMTIPQTMKHTYSKAGTYQVKFTIVAEKEGVEEDVEETKVFTKTIDVIVPAATVPAPAAPVAATQIPDDAVVLAFSCLGTTTPLEINCNPSPKAVDTTISLYNPMWNFGDATGDIPGTQNEAGTIGAMNHLYAAAGTYQVKFTIVAEKEGVDVAKVFTKTIDVVVPAATVPAPADPAAPAPAPAADAPAPTTSMDDLLLFKAPDSTLFADVFTSVATAALSDPVTVSPGDAVAIITYAYNEKTAAKNVVSIRFDNKRWDFDIHKKTVATADPVTLSPANPVTSPVTIATTTTPDTGTQPSGGGGAPFIPENNGGSGGSNAIIIANNIGGGAGAKPKTTTTAIPRAKKAPDVKTGTINIEDFLKLKSKICLKKDSTIIFDDKSDSTLELLSSVAYNGKRLVEGYLQENGNRLFNFDQPINRAELYKLVAFISCTPVDLPVTPSESFLDISPQDWPYEMVNSGKQLQIIKGFEDGKYFKPAQSTSRAEAAQLIMNVTKIDRAPKSCTKRAADVGMDSWFYEPSHDILCSNLLAGTVKDGKIYLRPDEDITRGEAALFIYNLAVHEVEKSQAKK